MSKQDYRYDVLYAVWRSGGNVDAVDYDRVEDHFDNGATEDQAAWAEMQRQQPQQEEYDRT